MSKKIIANGASKSRPAPAEEFATQADKRAYAANKTRFWNETLGEDIRKIFKRGY